MNSPTMTFKTKLADPSHLLTAHVCTIPSATVTQAMASAGSDAVIIDMEHGAIDYATAHAMIAATAGTSCAPLVRVTENDAAQVKRVLDLGPEGIVFALIRTPEDAALAVATLRYPPNGTRGFGPFLAHSRWGTSLLDYRETVDGRLVCCLLVETRDAIDNIEEICAVPGIDAIVPAQFDHPEFQAAIAKVEQAANAAGIPPGNVCLAKPQAEVSFAKGYRIIAGFDILWLKAMAAEAQSWTP